MIRVGVIEQSLLVSILHRVETHAKTGLLTLIHNEQEAKLYFQQGQLTSLSLKGHASLGERLVQARVISQDDLREAVLTLRAAGNHSPAPENCGDMPMARTLLELELVSREQLITWITQEAVKILHDLLTWSESEVYFVEGISSPRDHIPLDNRITSLISSLSNEITTSPLSPKEFTSMRGKLSLPTIPVTPPLFKKAQLGINGTSDPITSATPLFKKAQPAFKSTSDPITLATALPALAKTSTSGLQKISLPAKPLSAKHKASDGRIPTLSMKTPKSDPHLEMFNTISITALKAITNPKQMKNLKIRITGVILIFASLFYILWVIQALNMKALWFALPFFCATLFITLLLLITVYNNWSRSAPKLFKLPNGVEPTVAILIPTYGEPVEMVQKTIESIVGQDWPNEAMLIIVGDDSHRSQMQAVVENMQKAYSSAQIIYHLPPSKNSPERMGKAKDGNLNSMLKFVSENYPNILYIETRDADDIVGNTNFLRYTVGHLVSNPKAAYVQTIKEAMVGPGDPFGNLQPTFYRGLMLSKHATNSVFPCGSGLLWRKLHLDKIGGFPTWNLVEDLYSGYVALQHGLKGSYLPIVGAIGQTAPEDIPNVYKQLGTWALDTVRLFIWKNPWFIKGLTFNQKMHFTETGLYYLSSFIQFALFITPSICLFSGYYPLVASNPAIFISALLLYSFIMDLFVFFLGHDVTFKEHWRAKQLFVGMMFVYMKASLLAILYGPHKKPVYKVTRKVQMVGFYFKEVLLQILLFLLLLFSIIDNVVTHQNNIRNIDFGLIFWVLLYMLILSGVISKSWYGVKLSQLASMRNKKPPR